MTLKDEDVLLDVKNGIAVVTLNRPPANALSFAVRERVQSIFDEISDREDVRVAILTGSGSTFCAGADLKDRPRLDQAGAYAVHNRLARETSNAIRECSRPVIAAVNGPAIGAGFGLAAACDIILASDNAFFSMTEINVGLAGGAALLNEFLGRSRMRRMIFTGMRVSAAEFYRLGIIECCVAQKELLPEAMTIAAEIAEKNPTGIRYAKLSCNMVRVMPQRDAYRFEQNFTADLAATDNAKEARLAFLEKRKPVFKGK